MPGTRHLKAAVPLLLALASLQTRLANAAGSDPPDQLGEIVVTAQKRSSTVQETPISITAVTGDELQSRGTTDFDDLARATPGVSMRDSGPGQTEFEMRGLSSAGGNSPTVGFYLDDTSLTAPAAAQNGKVVIDPSLYDLNRVEVLRGPQGTLYGSGSMGGTIRVITNTPNLQAVDTSAQVTLSSTDGGGFNHTENGMANLPFGNGTAALRLVGSLSYQSGWIDRVVIAPGQFPIETNGLSTRGNVLAAPVAADYRNVNDERLSGGRASLLWKPIEQLTISPSVFYQQITQGGPDTFDSSPGTLAHYQPFDAPEPFSDRFVLENLNIQYQFESFDVISTTAHWNRNESIDEDGAENIQWGLGYPSLYPPLGFGPVVPTPFEDDLSRQFTEELRLTSTGDTKFKWLVGYFYQAFRSDWNLFIDIPGLVPLGLTSNFFTNYQPTTITQNAAFGEISYAFTPGLRATVGLRRYSFDTHLRTIVSGSGSPTGGDSVLNSSAGESSQGLNPKFDLSYEPEHGVLVYATAAKGFRPGGGNEPVPTGPTGLGPACVAALAALGRTSAPSTFGPDSLWSYELGEKLQLLDDRLVVNSAIYYERWTGVQQNIPLSCGFPYTDNAGDARIYGGELEISAVLHAGLIASAGTGYTNARISTGSLEAGTKPGDPLQNVPDWTASVSLKDEHNLTDQVSIHERVDATYVGPRIDATYSINHLPSYQLANLRAGVTWHGLTADLFADNVFNKHAWITDTTELTINTPTFNRVSTNIPLTVGIDFRYGLGRSPQ
jgi:iron complex outermembrane recepter protein